jgi:RNA polymerase sigma-70 factor (ECF subfamily)
MCPAPPDSVGTDARGPSSSPRWLERFHRGEREILEACYREHFRSVHAAVGRVLRGADQETVVHEVFYRLLSDAGLRASFRGGAFSAWLAAVARHQAIDCWRQRQREVAAYPAEASEPTEPADSEARLELRLFVQRFRTDVLPAKWLAVFDARFLGQLDQREAARRLGIRRTTLAYQELQIRRLLRRFVRKGQVP